MTLEKKSENCSITQTSFGVAPDKTRVYLFRLTNKHGMMVRISNFGGVITEIHTPDNKGLFSDVNLGFDSVDRYYKDSPYMGALIGRFGNRIKNGEFELDGKKYKLDVNNGKNHLHGGLQGFDKVVWEADSYITENSVGLKLFYLSKDGDQGYPGNLKVTVCYELTNDNEIIVTFHAVTDKATHVNLTQHSYFNLAGRSNVLNHYMMINADHFTPVDKTQIPTGEIRSVANTPFDFRTPRAIGELIAADDDQIKYGKGYDHNFVLNKNNPGELSLAAKVLEPSTGRVLEVFTTEPGIQFYSGNFLDGSLSGKGRKFVKNTGFCLEPQHFPDSPNHPKFPSTVLRPGEEYNSKMIYKFSVQS